MLEISNLTKHFGPITAVDDVSFGVEKGEVLGVLGPNGAGKSTTMKMVTGFLAPSSGTVRVAGDDIAQKPVSVKKKLGYLPEGAPLYADMTPLDFLRFVAELRGFKGPQMGERVAKAVDQVNLQSVLEQPISTLSKGFKRRVGLAQAILHDPDLLVLDEPTDGLDPNQKHEVRKLIREMAADKVIVLSTHILEEVDAVCGRVLVMAGGKVIVDSTPLELGMRSRWHNAVTIVLGGADVEVISRTLQDLRVVDSVEIVEEKANRFRLHIFPVTPVSIVAEVSQCVRDNGWKVGELHVERGRLDDVFRDITADRQGVS